MNRNRYSRDSTEETELIDQKVGQLTEEEVSKQDNNSTEIYQAKLKHLNKSRILNQLAYKCSEVKKQMFADSQEIVKVYELIFKNYSDKRIVIFNGKEDEEDSESRYTIMATNGSGIGIARLWRDSDSKTIEVGKDLGENKEITIRLDTINNYQELLSIMRTIGKDYDNISKIIKDNYTELKFKRFNRFFSKAVANVGFLSMPKNWGNNIKSFDNSMFYDVVEGGSIEMIEIKNISFDSSDTNTSDRISCNKSDDRARDYYSSSSSDFNFSDLQRVAPIFKEIYQALKDYLKLLEERGKIINNLKNEIKDEFARELVYEAFSKDEVKTDA